MSTFVERLLGGKAGTVVTVEPDWIVINDGVSHAAVEEISAVAKPEKVMVIYDHDVPTGRPEAAAILRKNLAFAEKYGCPYIQAEGVGYQYMLNEVVKPGQIIVGGGSHGSIFGSMSIGSTVARFKVKPADCFSSVMEAVNAPVMHAMLQNTAFSCASNDGA